MGCGCQSCRTKSPKQYQAGVEVSSSMRRVLARTFLALVLLALLLAGAGSYYAASLSQPHPDRFADSVLVSGPLLKQAASTDSARSYLTDFAIQEHWTSCGPASLRNVLVSLGDSVESEKALFHGDLSGWLKSLATGMTLDELASLARTKTVDRVEIVRATSLVEFQSALRRLSDPTTRIIANFDREPIYGVSVGHFSPLGSYDADAGLVMLLDVTKGYGFALVPDSLLYQSSRLIDPVSNLPRGLLVISSKANL